MDIKLFFNPASDSSPVSCPVSGWGTPASGSSEWYDFRTASPNCSSLRLFAPKIVAIVETGRELSLCRIVLQCSYDLLCDFKIWGRKGRC